jgi:hypothetical protein
MMTLIRRLRFQASCGTEDGTGNCIGYAFDLRDAADALETYGVAAQNYKLEQLRAEVAALRRNNVTMSCELDALKREIDDGE